MESNKYNLHYKIHFLFSCLLAFVIPVFQKAIVPIILVLVLNWLVQWVRGVKLKTFRPFLFFLPLLLFYVWHCISLSYSDDVAYGLFDLEIKMSMVVFPLLFGLNKPLSKKQVNQIFQVFIYGASFSVAFNIIRYFFRYLNMYEVNVDITGPFFTYPMHLGYFSWYLLTALFFVFKSYLSNPKKRVSNHGYKDLWISILLFFGVILTTSKTAYVVMAIMLIAFIIWLFISVKSIRVKIAVPLATLGIIVSLSYIGQNSYPARRLIKTTTVLKQAKYDPKSTESTQVRYFAWKTAFQNFTHNPIVGVGIGDQKQAMIETYKANGFEGALVKKLNAHNQYLQSMVALGAIGLLLLLITYFYPLFKFKGNILIDYLGFISITSLFSLTESNLEVQAGIVYFCFFYVLIASKYFSSRYDSIFTPSH